MFAAAEEMGVLWFSGGFFMEFGLGYKKPRRQGRRGSVGSLRWWEKGIFQHQAQGVVDGQVQFLHHEGFRSAYHYAHVA